MIGQAAPNRPSALRSWWQSLVAGLVFALVILTAAPIAEMPIRWTFASEAGEVAAPILFVGVLLTGWVLWWLLVARHGRAGWRRGGVTGVLVACLSYPVVLLLAEFFQVDWQSGPAAASLPERLLQVFELAAFGLLTTGFAATILLALAGVLVGAVQARLNPERGEAAARPPGILRLAFQGLTLGAVSIVILLVAAFAALSLLPIRPLATLPVASPIANHADALTAFARLREHEASLPLHPRCGSILLTHGEKVAQVVVYLHGLTNCPAQADELAPWLYAQGFNILVPRLPGHGEADPLTLALADVSAEDFVDTTRDAIALAQGLGDEVIILGLSAGGTLTAHQAQHASGVANSISIAPFLAPRIVPRWAAQAATNLLLLMPNMMVWWDPRTPYSSPEMDYAYPRFATRALAQVMRLGQIVGAEAGTAAPASQQVGFLLNEADPAVNNGLALQVVTHWREQGGKVFVRILPEADGLPHDLIDPRQPDAAIERIYPILLEMMSTGPAGR